jgi:hypothetical protein
MRNNLICTVGTSLLLNLRGLPTEQHYETWLGRQPERDRPAVVFQIWIRYFIRH